MERIKSIKQEKYVVVKEISSQVITGPLGSFETDCMTLEWCLSSREDLACRLPELDQPGSDQENFDSEASVSSESLLDERAVCSDTEGQY